MIPELGHFALILALLAALVQSFMPAFRLRAAAVVFSLCGLSFAALSLAYIFSDFSVMSVVRNSHSMKPLIYRISGVWGNHEGSILLWTLMLAGWGFAASRNKGLRDSFLSRLVAVQGMISAGFIFFVLFASNPFARIFPPAVEGMGLNPVLQDPALAIHPPFLYAGYVGFSVAFSFAVAALLEGRVDAEWARRLRPWVLSAWAFLTCGIALGSFWAYYELGWGGFWFWDPVENASLLPWLSGTALLHTLIVMEKRGALPGWSLFLAILTFSLSLFGTFLVRSGVLTSVHAFAVDPARGLMILLLLTFVIGGALALYAFRAPAITAGKAFSAVSRETALLLNNVFFFTFLTAVFLGTVYPVILSALDLGAISVGAPYFNAMLVPMLAPFAGLMGAVLFVPWRAGRVSSVMGQLKKPFFLSFLVLFLPFSPLALLGFFSAAWILWATVFSLRGKKKIPLSYAGMMTAHIGFAVLLAGVTAATQMKSENILWMAAGDRAVLAGHSISYLGGHEKTGADFNAMQGVFILDERKYLTPERRWYPVQETQTSESALAPDIFGSIFYVVLGEEGTDGRSVVRIYHHPLLLWIFAGAGLIALGGGISFADAVRKRKAGLRS